MEFSDYVGTLRRHAILIAAIVLLGALAGFLFARSSPPLYKSASSVFVSATRGENASDLVQGSVYTQNLMQSYAKLVQTPSVLGPVVKSLGLDVTETQLGNQVSSDAPLNTVIIVVTVTDESPGQAAAIANAVTAELATVAQGLSPKNADGTPGVTLAQVGKAIPPTLPFAPNTNLLVAGGAGLGLLLALGVVVGRQLVQRRIATESELRASAPAPLLGQLPQARGRAPHIQAKTGPSRDAFLRLADRVANAPGPVPLRSVVVTSAGRGEGRSHTALNLALAMAEFHGRVLLVDTDLRKPSVAQMCGLPPVPGLTQVLSHRATVETAVVPWRGIWVLPAGTPNENPTRALNSPAMAKTFIDLLRDYDFVVCDSTAMLAVADSLPLTRMTDGAVVVARVGKTRLAQLAAAVDAVGDAGGEVTGLVLNGVHRGRWPRLRSFRRRGRPAQVQSARPAPAAEAFVASKPSGPGAGDRRP